MNIHIARFVETVRSRFHSKLRLIVLISLTMLFLSMFNIIIAYLTPIVMIDGGMSELTMGIIYSTSSLFGVIFDFFLAKYLHTTYYKRLLLYTILIASLMPLALLLYQHIILYILAMLFWGLYSNLWGFAFYDFSAREAKIAFHATSMSLLFIFTDLGDLIGSLLAEPISQIVNNNTKIITLLAILTLALLSLSFSFLVKGKKEKLFIKEENSERGSFYKLLLTTKRLLPLLLFGSLLYIIEAIAWTITPIVERVAPQVQNYGGIILAITIVPSFLINILMQRAIFKSGKKRIAIFSFILGCIFMACLGITSSLLAYCILTFLYSTCFAIVYPLIGGAYADYLAESKSYDSEILSSRDIFTNIGYIIGPVLGTWLLSITNSLYVFTYLGLGCALFAIIILLFIPKSISFRDRDLNI